MLRGDSRDDVEHDDVERMASSYAFDLSLSHHVHSRRNELTGLHSAFRDGIMDNPQLVMIIGYTTIHCL